MGPDLLREDLAALYPQFGLRAAHRGLVLCGPTDVELLELVPIVSEPGGIVEPGREHEFLGWGAGDGDAAADHFLQSAWRARTRPAAACWLAPLAIVRDGRTVGMAALAHHGEHPAGTVRTWSWLARPEQGRGLGRRVRLMLLELAFAHLGADRALSDAAESNAASLRVSARCGYRETHRGPDQDGVASVFLAVTPGAWRRRRLDDVRVEGVEAFRAAIGP